MQKSHYNLYLQSGKNSLLPNMPPYILVMLTSKFCWPGVSPIFLS